MSALEIEQETDAYFDWLFSKTGDDQARRIEYQLIATVDDVPVYTYTSSTLDDIESRFYNARMSVEEELTQLKGLEDNEY